MNEESGDKKGVSDWELTENEECKEKVGIKRV